MRRVDLCQNPRASVVRARDGRRDVAMKVRGPWKSGIFACLVLVINGCMAAQVRLPRSLPGEVEFTATVKKSIATATVRAGDPVQFEMTDSVLMAAGTVVPAGARLHGTVLQSTVPDEDTGSSRLSILIERALWRGGNFPLHAYIVGQVARRRVAITSTEVSCESSRSASSDIDCWGQGKHTIETRSQPFESPTLPAHVGITLGAEGQTSLVSSRPDIVLKRGTILLLRHRPTTLN
jgi:hypothetical protein